ncbi:hypothetical protein [Anaeromyxobacter diazotrophicus]|uniref:Uncharacterized protein n=1 Tax=Anaeromyxobacter diazotrophicus TaxID=2590199 RepID=A0A7I9VLS6_9BACT|nr:hypothetical protein [Anaeromyxobacter diazotrophicus]GEJ57080.1 hypothetical protein AMYX_18210 [Anaeromyxobacter diazotrophicus]
MPARSDASAIAARALCALVLAAWAAAARGDSLSAVAEPSYVNSVTRTTDAAGNVTESRISQWLQRYRLALDKQLFPLVSFSGGGLYEWTLGKTSLDGVRTDQDLKRWTGYGRLTLGTPVLGGGLSYDRTEESSRVTTAGEAVSAPTRFRESYTAYAGWNPADLPSLQLRLSRNLSYDGSRRALDNATDEVFLGAIYPPDRDTDLRYSFRYTDNTDRVKRSESRDVVNAGRITRSDHLLDNRLQTYVSYSLAARTTDVLAVGNGGTVAVPQVPSAGLSLIEDFPATPERDTLAPNQRLVDGDLAGSAGIDLGFAPVLAGDVKLRDLGAQFGTSLSTVNTLYLWVDRQLPDAVANAVSFDVYRSDDNVTWARVDKAIPAGGGAPVQFSSLFNRFEITIQQTQARYLKVVAKGILPSVTADQRYANILVTELQFLQIVPAEQARASHTDVSGVLTASARYQILSVPNLAYDTSLFITHRLGPAQYTWSLMNGLSLTKRLSPIVGLSARLDRADSDETRGHVSSNRFSATLAADPLPTLGASATYNAQLGQNAAGTSFGNGATAGVRADLYQGVSLSANASYNAGRNENGQTITNAVLGANTTLTPNRLLALTGSAAVSSSSASAGAGRPETTDRSRRLEGTASFTPVPALALSGGVARVIGTRGTTTLANFNGSFSPFPGGTLLLRFGYSETLDTAADLKTRQYGPSLRWNIRQGTFVDVSYSLNDTHSPALDTSSRSLFAGLVLALR